MRKRQVLLLLLLLVALLAANFIFPRASKPEISIKAEGIPLLGLQLPNTLIASWLAMVLLTVLSIALTRRMRLVPGRAQTAVEGGIQILYDLTSRVAGERTQLIFPVMATIFLFVITANWMGLLPGFGSVGIVQSTPDGEQLIPLLRSANTDLNTTIALAVFAMASIQVIGLRALGPSYLSRFLDLHRLFSKESLVQRIAGLFIGVLELFDQLTKVVSFAFRLFGNIFAGEVLLLVVAFLLPIMGPLPFMALELFVGFIQALIFGLLTVVYAAAATSHGIHAPTESSDQPEPLSVSASPISADRQVST